MEIKLMISQVLTPLSGVSRNSGNSWMKQDYVGETFDQYPKKVVFGIFGEDAIKKANIQQGMAYNVSFDIESRPWSDRNGVERWSTEIRAWKVEPAQAEQPKQPQQAYQSQVPQSPQPIQAPVGTAPQPMAEPQPSEDLPF